MSEEIKIKKSDLWKFSTVILLVVVVLVIFLGGNNSSASGNATSVANGDSSSGDVSVFTDNPNVYPSLGPDNAAHVFVEFADFQCVWCADAAGLSLYWKQLSQTNTQVASVFGSMGLVEKAAESGKVKFVYVPVSFFGAESTYTAEAAYCALEQGKFWEMHDAIFTAHDGSENDGQFAKDKLEALAAKIGGLDTDKFNSCLESDKYLSTVKSSTQAAQSFGVSGTPTVYYDGQKINPTVDVVSGLLGE